MILSDKNQSWQPPEGYGLASLSAEGSFLRLVYRKQTEVGHVVITVYLNDMGREVLRTQDTIDYGALKSSATPVAGGFWKALRDGFKLFFRGE